MPEVTAPQHPLGPILGEGERELPFGKYTLLRKIAVGGMAEVYLAKAFGQFGFEKPVVMKVLLPRLAENQEFREMFVHEALVAADFRHPRLCQVYDVGEVSGSYYICMEFVDGVDLTRVVRRARAVSSPMALPLALRVVRELTEGLQYVHTATAPDGAPLHIVHRDVTPQNIMIAFDGQVKLVDFGVAKTTFVTEGSETSLKGKGPYMAPEQWRGDPVDGRADLFALGIVLYELTLGRRLFKRTSPDLVRKAILAGDVPRPRQVRPNLPKDLETVLLRALALRPDDRYRTAAEMGAAIAEVQADLGFRITGDELGAYVSHLFLGLTRNDIWRSLELTAPGVLIPPAPLPEREDETEGEVPVPPVPAAPAHPSTRQAWAWLLLGVLGLGLVAGAFFLGAWSRLLAPPATPRTAPAPAAPAGPTVVRAGDTPAGLRGCTASFARVSLDPDGRVTEVGPEPPVVRCTGGSPPAGSGAAAAAALRSFTFAPVRWEGRGVATTTPVTVRFTP